MHDSQDSYYRDPEFLEILAKWEDIEERGGNGYMDADDLADVAEYYYTNHHRAKGDRCIDFALQLHPSSADVLTFKARSLMLQHKYEEAAKVLDNADDQNNRELIYLRAELLIVAGKRRAAEMLLQEHIPDDNEDDEEESAQSYTREVIGLWLDYDDVSHAGQWADRLRTLPNLKSKDRIMLADYASVAGQSRVAYSILQDIVENDPYNISAWNLLSEVGFDEENYHEAADACEMVLAIDEDNYQATVQLARINYTQGNLDGAIALARSGCKKWPEDEICPLYQGMSQLQLYYTQEEADYGLLHQAYDNLRLAERLSDGQSLEQPNIVLNLAYVMSEFFFTATTQKAQEEYRSRTIEYVRQMIRYGSEMSQVAFQLGNMLLEMGETALANELLALNK